MFTAPHNEIVKSDGFKAPDQDLLDQSQPPESNVIENAGKDISGIAETLRRGGQGIIDFPQDVYQSGKQIIQGRSPSDTPIGQDVKTLGNVALESLPHGVNENGSYKIEPGTIFRQYQDLAAQPLKMIPGKVGETMKQAYPENPLTEHPVNSALALAPLAKPLFSAAREIPAVDEGLNNASRSIRENVVAPNARRSLGKFPMKMPVEEANQVGLDAMDKGIIKNPITSPFQSTPKAMLSKVSDLNESLGENIGAFLKGQNESLDATKAMQELDQIKAEFMDDPKIISKVEDAQARISRNSTSPIQSVMRLKDEPQKMEFAPANKLKSLFQDEIDYNSPKNSQKGSRAIASTFRNSIDSQLDELSAKLGNREGMDQFRADKKDFGSTRKMEDALTGQVNRDARNMPVSLPGTVVSAAAGGLKGLVYEWTKKYGSQVAASMANDVSKLLQSNPSAELSSASVAKATMPAISKAEVKQYLDQANGDRQLAKRLAKKDGKAW